MKSIKTLAILACALCATAAGSDPIVTISTGQLRGSLTADGIAVFKNIPIHERLRVQFRSEFFNVFNHTQFTTWDNTARFDPAGRQLNGSFGQATAAAAGRIVQFSLRACF